MIKKFTPLHIQLFILTISLFSLGSAFYLEYVQHQYPCNLCLAQRFCYYVIITVTLLSMIGEKVEKVKKAKKLNLLIKILDVMGLLLSLSGLTLAGRQIYLQRFADTSAMGCGIDLVSMFEMFAPTTVLQKLFEGTTDCAEIKWTFLSLSIADYSALLFVVMVALHVIKIKKKVAFKITSEPTLKVKV